jgi:hypothetical protein
MMSAALNMTRSLRGAVRPSVMISVAAVLAAAMVGVALIFAMGVPVVDAVGAFVDGTIGTPTPLQPRSTAASPSPWLVSASSSPIAPIW